MPWFKIDDGFHCHPKALAAGNAAIGLWSRLGSYSSDQLTDGFIPTAIAKGYGTRTELTRLINVRLIEPGDHELYGPGYWLHDFLDYNPTANKVRDDRAAAAERQRKSRTMSQRDNTVTHEHNDETLIAVTDGTPSGYPSVTTQVTTSNKRKRKPVDNQETAGRKHLGDECHAVTHTTPSRPVPTRPDTTQLPTTSSVLRAVPEQDDDDFLKVIDLVIEAKEREYQPAKPRAWRQTVRMNTIAEDGDLIRLMLADGPPEDVAMFVLGHRHSDELIEETALPWCTRDCPDCGGDAWVHTDAGLAPCPHRHAS